MRSDLPGGLGHTPANQARFASRGERHYGISLLRVPVSIAATPLVLAACEQNTHPSPDPGGRLMPAPPFPARLSGFSRPRVRRYRA